MFIRDPVFVGRNPKRGPSG